MRAAYIWAIWAAALSGCFAADTIFMKIDGIGGEVAEKGLEGWIAVHEASTELERSTTSKLSAKLGLEKRPRSMLIQKNVDKATLAIAEHVKEGKPIQEMTLKFFRDPALAAPYFAMVLKNATIVTSRIHKASDGVMREELAVDYEDLELIALPGGEKYIFKK